MLYTERHGTKAKCRHLKKLTFKGTLRQVLYVCGPLPSYDPISSPYTQYTCILYTYSHKEGKGGGEVNQREG